MTITKHQTLFLSIIILHDYIFVLGATYKAKTLPTDQVLKIASLFYIARV
jgi:hypothetical protein